MWADEHREVEPESQALCQHGRHLQSHPGLAWPTLPIPAGWGDAHKLQVTGQGSPKLVCILNTPKEPGRRAGKVLTGLATAAGNLRHRSDHNALANCLTARAPSSAHTTLGPTF